VKIVTLTSPPLPQTHARPSPSLRQCC